MTYTAEELQALGRRVDPRAVELRKWRRAHHLSQAELAAILGVDVHQLVRFETGVIAMPRAWPPLIDGLYRRWSDARMPHAAQKRAERRRRTRP